MKKILFLLSLFLTSVTFAQGLTDAQVAAKISQATQVITNTYDVELQNIDQTLEAVATSTGAKPVNTHAEALADAEIQNGKLYILKGTGLYLKVDGSTYEVVQEFVSSDATIKPIRNIQNQKLYEQSGKNKLNPNDPRNIANYIIDGVGGFAPNASNDISHPIRLEDGETSIWSGASNAYYSALYDEFDNYISGTAVNSASVTNNTGGIAYARHSINGHINAESTQVEIGTVATAFEVYKPVKLIQDNIDSEAYRIASNQDSKVYSERGKNLLNPNDDRNIYGAFLNSALTEVANASYDISHPIKLENGQSARVNVSIGGAYSALFDQYDKPISGTGVNSSTITNNTGGVAYARFSVNGNIDAESTQIEIGTTSTTFEKFYYLKSLQEQAEGVNASITYLESDVKKFTGEYFYDKRIKELKLVGLDSQETYYISRIRNDAGQRFLVINQSSDDTTVARLWDETTNNGGWYYIPELNASGIYGYVVFADEDLYSYVNLNLEVNQDVVSQDYESMLAYFNYDFLDRDNTSRINKLNPLDIVEKTQYTSSGGHLTATSSTDFFNTAKFFPIADGEKITISDWSLQQCRVYLVDKYRKVLENTQITTGTSLLSYTVENTYGEDLYVAFTYRYKEENDLLYPQVEYSDSASDYEAYRPDGFLRLEDKVDLILPDKLYLTVGEKYNFYKKAMINANPLKDLTVTATNATDNTCRDYIRQFGGTPASAGVGTMTFNLYDNKRMLSQIKREFNKITKTTGTINVFPMGDSFTDINYWVQALKDNATDDGVTMNLIGLKNGSYTGYNTENQTGGTLDNSFLVDRGAAYVLAVTGFTDDGSRDGYLPDLYTDSNGYEYYIDGRKVDSNGNGVLRIRPNNHANVPPTNSTLTQVSGIGSFSTIPYTTVDTINRNALWNPSTSEVDFSYYFDYYGWSTDFDLVNDTFVTIMQFSWNDIERKKYSAENITEVVTAFQTAINQFHTEYPNAYVIIGLEPPTALVTGLDVNGGYRYVETQWQRAETYKAIFETFQGDTYSSFVFINPGYMWVDLENGYNTEAYTPDDRTGISVDRITDPIHPSQIGMSQLGDSYRGLIHYILSL
ncbi:hypothetical protein SAMN05216480_12316 [Pustulibacterium marinum]|uniref:Uncharacterized protein n=1 Tax=Pustulibacterium marinum TaxID=1224947 RepID=A0A1I7IW28_9FLAO|nr:hypothetical protein [Pustulibacterium marinum]SFU77099.1 hypothetical protein SAMN05216480_12316 [Pustulibacterium marinum]